MMPVYPNSQASAAQDHKKSNPESSGPVSQQKHLVSEEIWCVRFGFGSLVVVAVCDDPVEALDEVMPF
jgi:hypothetical protein